MGGREKLGRVSAIGILILIGLMLFSGFNFSILATEDEAEKQNQEEKPAQMQDVGEPEIDEESGLAVNLENTRVRAKIYTDKSYVQEDPADETVIILEGKLPKHAAVRAYRPEIKLNNETPLLAYDITIFDANGSIYQPEENASIKVSVESDKLRTVKNMEVFHMKDENDSPELINGAQKIGDGEVSFEAKSFSIYIINEGEHSSEFHHTYRFFDKNGDEIVGNRQVIAVGQVLKQPQAPGVESHIFDGWYTDKEAGHKFEQWNIEGELTQDKETLLYARYRKVYHVYYKAEAKVPTDTDPVMVIFTQSYGVNEDEKINFDDIPFTTEEGKALVGWSLVPNDESTMVKNHEYVVKEDIRLFPIIKDAYWIDFESQGGSYIPSKYVLKGDYSVAPDKVPTKPGYTFDGWYTDKDTSPGNRYSFNQKLDKSITLYAKWKIAPTDYTVVFWQQDINDRVDAPDDGKKYNFVSSETRTAYPGEIVNATYADTRLANTANYQHFHYNENKRQAVEVKPDGTTVVNVYYDRDVMSIKFLDQYGYEISSIGTYRGLHGAPLSNYGYRWPILTGYKLYNKKSNSNYTFLDAFLFPEGSYNKYTNTMELTRTVLTNASNARISHFKESISGGYASEPDNYTFATGSTFSTSNKYNGFTIYQKQSSYIPTDYYGNTYAKLWGNREATATNNDIPVNKGSHINGNGYRYYYYDLNLFYKRNTYKFKYAYGKTQSEIVGLSKNALYETKIGSSYNLEEPSKPRDILGNPLVPDFYKFRGWFKDPNGNTPYEFDGSEKMPSNDVVVFAVWKPDKVTLSFDTKIGKTIPNQTVDAGSKVFKPESPERDGYRFAGWVREDGRPFNFNEPLKENTKLIAQWVSDKGYRINYMPGKGASGAMMKGPKIYAPGSPARVVGINPDWGWIKPEGNTGFLYWSTDPDDKGKRYYPGEDLYLSSNELVLYAIWSDHLDATLKYDLNYDPEVETDESLVLKRFYEDNSTFNIGEDGISSYTKRKGYRFMGWSKNKQWDGVSKLVQNGEPIEVNKINEEKENILYAQWKRSVDILLKVDVKGNAADRSKRFNFDYTIEKNGRVQSGIFEASPEELYKKITGISEVSAGTKVTVTQRDYDSEGYVFRGISDINKDGSINQGTVTGQSWSFVIGEDTEEIKITFTNEKNQSPPTGIKLKFIPYAALVTCAVSVLLIYKKRRRADDD